MKTGHIATSVLAATSASAAALPTRQTCVVVNTHGFTNIDSVAGVSLSFDFTNGHICATCTWHNATAPSVVTEKRSQKFTDVVMKSYGNNPPPNAGPTEPEIAMTCDNQCISASFSPGPPVALNAQAHAQ